VSKLLLDPVLLLIVHEAPIGCPLLHEHQDNGNATPNATPITVSGNNNQHINILLFFLLLFANDCVCFIFFSLYVLRIAPYFIGSIIFPFSENYRCV
jgi:hypothetical protein